MSNTRSILTGRNEVVAKVMFLLEFVILFTGGWGCLSQCMLGCHTPPPRIDTPLGTDNPLSRHPPSRHAPPGADTPQSRHPPEQTPPGTKYTPLGLSTPWTKYTPEAKYTPLGLSRSPRTKYTPPEADSSIWPTSGRYASYWNAFLLCEMLRHCVSIGSHHSRFP